MTGPLVSVCIPAYNAAATIEACVRSALASTYEHLEVLVLDDASTDDTAAILATIDDARLRVVRNDENRGRAGNLRRSLDLGTGEWLAILPADCTLPATSIEHRLGAARSRHGVTFAFGPVQVEGSAGEDLGTRRFGDADAVLAFPRSTDALLPSNRVFPVSCLISAAAYRDVGGLRVDVAPTNRDWDLLLRLALSGPVAYTAETVAVEKVHEGNATVALVRDDQIVTAELLILESVRRWARQHRPQAVEHLDRAMAQWSHRRLAHALLGVAGFVDSSPTKALGCALAANPRMARSLRYALVLLVVALPRGLVRLPLRVVLAPIDRRRRRRWNLA